MGSEGKVGEKQCFWCLGTHMQRLSDEGKPVMVTFDPCDKCKSEHGEGILLIETVTFDNGVPDISKGLAKPGLHPTGRWAVYSEEGVKSIFNKDVADKLLRDRQGLVDEETFNHITAPLREQRDPKTLN